ncbi:MAG: type II toxin-antitoxin system ParD family antitoxin [Pseudomonadota bacterium]
MSINISLPPELERRVRQRVESGLYGSASEVVREALRLLDQVEASRAAALTALRDDIALGLADREAGRVVDFDPQAIKSKGRALLEPDRS